MTKAITFRLPVAVLLASSVLSLHGVTAYPQPRIEFEELTYDWGRINEGERATYAFRFQNTGNKTLQIKKVKSS